jgi:hypothetical protein
MYVDKRILIGGIVLAVLLIAWALGEKHFPLARMVSFGLKSILH